MSASLIDWPLAERVSLRVAGAGDADARQTPSPLSPGSLTATCREAQGLIRGYSGLDPQAGLPAPEAVGRAEWSRSALGTVKGLTDDLQRENDIEISLPGPLGSVARSVIGAATGTEVGLAAGYAARRVLGQYDLPIVGPDRAPRLLFVAPNLAGAAADLGVETEPFVRWVALHETTHAIQFAVAPWLRDELGGLVRRLLSGAAANVRISDLLRRAVSDPRGAVSGLLRGDIARAIAGPEQLPTLDRIQATMTVIEGHAEHVMDAAAAEFVPDVEGLRRRLESRRSSRGPLETIVGRLLGLDLKLRQYRLGKSFCDEVAAQGGAEALNRVWDGPGSLPTLAELDSPAAWLERIATNATATAR